MPRCGCTAAGRGEAALTETLGLITPWNTASDKTTLGAMQIEQAGTGILPGITVTQAQADALAANEETLREPKGTTAERTAFTEAALEVLAPAAAESETQE